MSEPSTLLPATIDYGPDEGAGFENQRPEDIQIPFVALLQDLSPQVTGADGRGVEGAKAGKLLNTATGEVLGDSIQFVPARYEHCFCEYIPRDQGGGFLGRHLPEAEMVVAARAKAGTAFGRLRTPDGHELVETYYLFGVAAREGGSLAPAVLSFTSTKITVFKKWTSATYMFTIAGPEGRKFRPPIFAHLLKVCTIRQKNKKGTFFNFLLQPANGTIASSLLPPTDPRFGAAKEIGKMVAAGKARAAEESPDEVGDDAEVPF